MCKCTKTLLKSKFWVTLLTIFELRSDQDLTTAILIWAVRHYAILNSQFWQDYREQCEALRGDYPQLLTITMSVLSACAAFDDYLQSCNVRSGETNRSSDQVSCDYGSLYRSTIKARSFWPVQFLTILVQQLRGRVKIVLAVQCDSHVHYRCTQVVLCELLSWGL